MQINIFDKLIASITSKPISDNFIVEWREALLDNPYMDVFNWLERLGIENKQGNINTEESSSILKKLSLTTYESEYKVMVIWMAEKMNAACSNKLLKILEEPPEKTLFLFVNIVISIVSRLSHAMTSLLFCSECLLYV